MVEGGGSVIEATKAKLTFAEWCAQQAARTPAEVARDEILDDNDYVVDREFKHGRRVIRRWTPDWGGRFEPAPQMTPIESWDQYLKVRNFVDSAFLTEEDAQLYHGWKRPWGEEKPVSPAKKVAQLVEDYRAEGAAKRIIQAEQNPVQPLVLKSVKELLEAPAPDWWIDGILPKDAVVIVGGDGGVGKSAMLIEMVARLSTGTPFLGNYAARQARVLYAVGEGISGYGARFHAVEKAHGLAADKVAILAEGVSLTSAKSMEQVADVVAQNKVEIVIFDTLSSLSTLESENDAAEVGRVMNAAKRVREANPGCTVILVHHTSKASGGLRGSSVIRDNADAVWMLKGDPDAFFMSTKSKHGGKVKDGEPMEIHGLSLVGAHGSVIVESASMPHEASAASDRRGDSAARHLEDGKEYTTAELRDIVRKDDGAVSERTADRVITTLLASDKITSLGKGRYLATSRQ